MRRTPDEEDKIKGVGELWRRQDEVYEFDFDMYNTKPWMLAKVFLGIIMITIFYLLYALHEIPWAIFGSGIGLVLFGVVPFFVGLIVGLSFDSMKMALTYAVIIGLAALILGFIIFTLPYNMNMAEYEPGFMIKVWGYLFIGI